MPEAHPLMSGQKEARHAGGKEGYALPLRIGIRKELPNVWQRQRTQYRIYRAVVQHISILHNRQGASQVLELKCVRTIRNT